jgi:hypothetical protein
MAKITKIGMVRDELDRIASAEDRQDLVVPTMKASWSFTRMMVIGKLKMQAFDFDVLQELLKKVPTGAGEMQFWHEVDAANSQESAIESTHECVVVQLADRQQTQEAQA